MEVTFPATNHLSIWIGYFEQEQHFNACVEAEIAPCLGMGGQFNLLAEDAFENEPLAVEELLEGFTHWRQYTDAARTIADSYGVEAVNAAVVVQQVICHEAPPQWGHFYFLGSFEAVAPKKIKHDPRKRPSDEY
ncbi:MAG: hypothetical protein AAGK14_08525 [Verrucomicrobiota bacterium]